MAEKGPSKGCGGDGGASREAPRALPIEIPERMPTADGTRRAGAGTRAKAAEGPKERKDAPHPQP